MSKVKAAGSSKNNHKSPGQRLGLKKSGGQVVRTGQVIFRQVGATKRAGEGTFMSRNFTIHAARDGIVSFRSRKQTLFSGRSTPRVEISVI